MGYVCECGRIQRQHTPLKEFTEKDVRAVGWRKIEGEWVCPVCCNNKAALNNIPNDLSCVGCHNGMDALLEREKESLEVYGWYTHIIIDDPHCPYGMNIHTHGLPEMLNHPDLQICVPVDPKILHNILADIINEIELGRIIPVGKSIKIEGIINGYPFLFVKVKESGRDILRVIISDKNKNLDRETMGLEKQWEGAIE